MGLLSGKPKWVPSRDDAGSRRVDAALAHQRAQKTLADKQAAEDAEREARLTRPAKKGTGVRR